MQPIATAPHYLLLDRTDPTNPRWVIAQARASLPAEVPDDLDDTDAPAGWLSTFGHDHFAWLADTLDEGPSVRVPQHGRGCHATRIVPAHRAPLEHDQWGLGWYDGWDGVVHDTWTGPDDD